MKLSILLLNVHVLRNKQTQPSMRTMRINRAFNANFLEFEYFIFDSAIDKQLLTLPSLYFSENSYEYYEATTFSSSSISTA